jgi:hypothetical protein
MSDSLTLSVTGDPALLELVLGDSEMSKRIQYLCLATKTSQHADLHAYSATEFAFSDSSRCITTFQIVQLPAVSPMNKFLVFQETETICT